MKRIFVLAALSAYVCGATDYEWLGGTDSAAWDFSANWAVRGSAEPLTDGWPGDGAHAAGLVLLGGPSLPASLSVPAGGVTMERIVTGYGKEQTTPPFSFVGGPITLTVTSAFRSDGVNPVTFDCPLSLPSAGDFTSTGGLAFHRSLDCLGNVLSFGRNTSVAEGAFVTNFFEGADCAVTVTNAARNGVFEFVAGTVNEVKDGARVVADVLSLRNIYSGASAAPVTLKVADAAVKANVIRMNYGGGSIEFGPGSVLSMNRPPESGLGFTVQAGFVAFRGTPEAPVQATANHYLSEGASTATVEHAELVLSWPNTGIHFSSSAASFRIGAGGRVTAPKVQLFGGEVRVGAGGSLALVQNDAILVVREGGRFAVDGGRLEATALNSYFELDSELGGEFAVLHGGSADVNTIACRKAPNRVVVGAGSSLTLDRLILSDSDSTPAEACVTGRVTAASLLVRNAGAVVTLAPGGWLGATSAFTASHAAEFRIAVDAVNKTRESVYLATSPTVQQRIALTGPAALEPGALYKLVRTGGTVDLSKYAVTYNGAAVTTDGSGPAVLVKRGDCVAIVWVGEEPAGNAARIGETEYDTLAAAFAAAKDGETVTLLRNCRTTAGIGLDGKHVTLDGAGWCVLGILGEGACFDVAAGAGLHLKDVAIVVVGGAAAVASAADLELSGRVNAVGGAVNVALTGAAQIQLVGDLTGAVGVSSGTGAAAFGRANGFAGAECILNETAGFVDFSSAAQTLADGTLAWKGPGTVLEWRGTGNPANLAWGTNPNSYTTHFRKPGGTVDVTWEDGMKALFGRAGTVNTVRVGSTKVAPNEIIVVDEGNGPLTITANDAPDVIRFCGDDERLARLTLADDLIATNAHPRAYLGADFPQATNLVVRGTRPAGAALPVFAVTPSTHGEGVLRNVPVRLEDAALRLELDRISSPPFIYGRDEQILGGRGDLVLHGATAGTNEIAVSLMSPESRASFAHTGRTVVDGNVAVAMYYTNSLSANSALVVTNGAWLGVRWPLGGAASTNAIFVARDSTLWVRYVSSAPAFRSTLGTDRTLTVDGGRVELETNTVGHTENDVPRDTWLCNGGRIESPGRLAFPGNESETKAWDTTIHTRGAADATNVVTAALAARAAARYTGVFDVESPLLLEGGLSGARPLRKEGAGPLILAGHDARGTLTGAFTHAAGTLAVLDADVLAESSVTVCAGAVLEAPLALARIGALAFETGAVVRIPTPVCRFEVNADVQGIPQVEVASDPGRRYVPYLQGKVLSFVRPGTFILIR